MSKPCKLVEASNGKVSKLYKALQKELNNRPLANLLYASYLQPGVAKALTDKFNQTQNPLYKVDDNGEHSAKAVIEFFDGIKMANEFSKIRNDNYDTAEEAFEKAQEINNTTKGKVAYVVENGDKFSVVKDNRTATTFYKASEVESQIKVWDRITQEFADKGVDMKDLSFLSNANALHTRDLLQYLWQVSQATNDLLTNQDVKTLLTIGKNIPQVQNLISKFGNLDNAINAIINRYAAPNNTTDGNKALIDNVMSLTKNYPFNITDLYKVIKQEQQDFDSQDPKYSILQTLKDLRKKYCLDDMIIVRNNNQIQKLQDAAAEAVLILQRQIRELESRKSKSAQERQNRTIQIDNLQKELKKLTEDISAKRYFNGTLGVLKEAVNYGTAIQKMLENIPTCQTVLETNLTKADIMSTAKRYVDGYKILASAIKHIDSLVMDQNLSDSDKKTLQDVAKQVSDMIDNTERMLDDLGQEVLTDMATSILGDAPEMALSVHNLVQECRADSSMYDFFYSVGRQSNPLIGVMGTIIKNAQDSRNEKLNKFSLDIRKANNKLAKAQGRTSGADTKFMYRSQTEIISDIDWEAYDKAREAEKLRLQANKLWGIKFKLALQQWEDANTEDRIVDDLGNGEFRTEKVPNANYRRQDCHWDNKEHTVKFDNLTKEEQEYYDSMMHLKGKIGTLMPDYAQKHYMPAQVRNSWVDVVTEGIKNGTPIKKIIANLLDRMKWWKVRENDADYINKMHEIDGEKYRVAYSDFDSTPLRDIPLFCMHKIEDPMDFLMDFSTGIQQLAATAVNYDAMNRVKNLVEVLGNQIKKIGYNASANGENQVDRVVSNGVTILKKIKAKYANSSNISNLIDGFIDWHLYGITMKDTGKWARFARGIINYSSLRSLSTNLKGAVSNYLVGEFQMMIEAGGGEFYNLKDYTWAHAKLFGDNTIGAPGRLMDFLTNNKNSKAVLLEEMFDPLQDNFSDNANKRFHSSAFRQLFGGFNAYGGYASGEYLIHYVTMYAMLNHQKVFINGEKVSLYDAFSVKKDDATGTADLELNTNATLMDKNGNDSGVKITQDFIDEMRRKIRFCNQNCHGSMNTEDKGLIHQHMLGRAVMNMRQWMVEHYSRRYRDWHWDSDLQEYRRGYKRPAMNLAWEILKGGIHFQNTAKANWNNMSEQDKYNVKKTLSEYAVFAGLFGLSFALGSPTDHKKEWWTRFWIYQVGRALLDFRAATIPGLPYEADTIINSPIAATNTVAGLLYPFAGLVKGDEFNVMKSGAHKGENRYWYYLKKKSFPFVNHIMQLNNMDTDDGIFKALGIE